MPFGTGEGFTPFFFGLIARWKATVSLGKATFLPDCCRIELCCAICTETTCAPVLLISQWLESVPWGETEGVHTRTHAGRWGKITKTSLPSIGLCWLAYRRCSMLHPSAFPERKRRLFARCNRVENNISSFDVYFPTTLHIVVVVSTESVTPSECHPWAVCGRVYAQVQRQRAFGLNNGHSIHDYVSHRPPSRLRGRAVCMFV